MTMLIDKRGEYCVDYESEVFNGQVREDSDGRIVMVITDDRWCYHKNDIDESVLKLLVLSEGLNGGAEDFTTVPSEDYTKEEVVKRYPKVLVAEIVIKGVK